MRRSKSNPAKYAKNYRRISQRRMTEHDEAKDEDEIRRLESMIEESNQRLAETNEATTETTEASSSILSPELMEDLGDDAVVLRKRKKQKKAPTVVLTPQERKHAQQKHKQLTRKLQQLKQRSEQKQRRKDLYEKLEKSKVEQIDLLQSSAELGKRKSKKEELQQILHKERAGLKLTEEEHEALYPRRSIGDVDALVTSVEASVPSKGKKRQRQDDPSRDATQQSDGAGTETVSASKAISSTRDCKQSSQENPSETPTATSFAAQMMASLTTLKKKSESSVVTDPRKSKGNEMDVVDRTAPTYGYAPSEPVPLVTAATMKLTPAPLPQQRKVREVKRPEDVVASRLHLPVARMEFEVMDAVRNNDVTILCGETGSGKSTQLPQFLYEYGLTRGGEFLVGVTQPRRVAAVSTAKRVSYEMGQSNGYQIRGGRGGSLVAYQTRYEAAGNGPETHIKFMTDGILLQEIQSDLLLRKYSVIVLDEVHERGLNTDVLIGLLSASIPLRKKAAAEEGATLAPLKLVVMSATLRVQDFTENERLFPGITPAVVKVPGRTHPVTIHHSKITELDEYEDAAFRTICKIHRKLPQGGCLVFLTGKQEIMRMMKRLQTALNGRSWNQTNTDVDVSRLDDGALRELDDEEVDGDILAEDEEMAEPKVEVPLGDDRNENAPAKALILPLYSLLSEKEQAKVFEAVPENTRLIVLATNIAETSITIPNISYVVDTGRQKNRNYNQSTGVASYDIMWISKAAADQRAGRAGRTGPGHCYRLFSSSMYSRHMDQFALPEVLSRPLEDVVLAMKAMKISNISAFPFPTAPDLSAIDAATTILASLGCLDITSNTDDGEITKLGLAVSQLPLGVRHGKILLVAANAGVLDYAIAIIAGLSEVSPFGPTSHGTGEVDDKDTGTASSDSDSSGSKEASETKPISKEGARKRWFHKNGDMLALLVAIGAYTFAGKGAGGASERLVCRSFCERNGLNSVVMERIQRMRQHIAKLANTRMRGVDSVASKTGSYLCSQPPPNALEERLLQQAIASGLLDNVATLAPVGVFQGNHPFGFRSAYMSASMITKEPLFIDRNSVLHTKDFRRLPTWVCFEGLVRKTLRDGTSVALMKNVTPIDPSWLGTVSTGSKLLTTGAPLLSPPPSYDPSDDTIRCSVGSKYGVHGWEIPSIRLDMKAISSTKKSELMNDEIYRWFARFLLEGKVLTELKDLPLYLSDSPAVITRRAPMKKVALLVSALEVKQICSARTLTEHWATKDDKFLFRHLKQWINANHMNEARELWISTVKKHTR